MKELMAVILAGGAGERKDVLCNERPKPALPFAGQYKVIDFSLSNCVFSHVKNIAVLAGSQPREITDYVNHWRQANAPSADLRVLEPKNESSAGYPSLNSLLKNKDDAVIVMDADRVYKMDYRKMLDFHRRAGADVTIGVVPVTMREARRLTTVKVNEDGRISHSLSDSAIPLSNLAVMGVYIFDKKLLAAYLAGDSLRADSGLSLLPGLIKTWKVFAYRFEGYWQDTTSLETYFNACMELTREKPGFTMSGISPVLTVEHPLPAPCIGKEAIISRSIVSAGCVVRGRIENSILSPNVWVEEGAVVRNSVIMGNTFIGRRSVIERAILDEGVRVGEYSRIGNSYGDDKQEITVLQKGEVTPPYAIVGKKNWVEPAVERGPFCRAPVINTGRLETVGAAAASRR
jgi:glucose-1-phosphate adenylyltransferase